jgi:hypothetical protein
VLVALARRLLRHFLAEDGDRTAAFAAALHALLACHPESLTDALAAARLIALSFATLIASDKAADPDIPERQQLQYLTKTNTLCRTAQKAEAAIARPRPRTADPTTANLPAAETMTQTANQATANQATANQAAANQAAANQATVQPAAGTAAETTARAAAPASPKPAAPARPALRYPTEAEADAIFNSVMAEIRATRPRGTDPRSDAFWTALRQCADTHAPQPAASPARRPAANPAPQPK